MSIVLAWNVTDGNAELPASLSDSIVHDRNIGVSEAFQIRDGFLAAGADFGVDLEGHPIFLNVELGSNLVEDGLPDVAERSIEVIEYYQFVSHVFLFFHSVRDSGSM